MMKTKRWYVLMTITTLLLAAAALVALALVGSGSPAVAAPGEMAAAAISGQAMAALPEVTCTVDTAVTPNVRTCELWATSGSLAMPDGVSVPVWGFAASAAGSATVPGPVIRANVDETLEIVLHNEVAGETVALAFPGQELIPDLDGVASGAMAIYTLTPAQAGTFLYEAGPTPGGSRQVAMGLFGPLIVGELATADQVLVFSEIDPSFNADPLNFSMYHFDPKYWLINGQAYPDTGYIPVAAGDTLHLRYLNASVEHRTIGLLGLNQQVVAAGGEELPFHRGAVAERLAPGETREALVQVPASAETGTLYPVYNASLHQHNNNQRLSDMRAAFGGMLTFLQVTGGSDPGGAGPVASNVAVTPQKTNGTEPVTLTATFTDADANVIAYEYYVDQPGTLAGSGTVASPASSVNVTVNFLAADVNTLPSGEHVFYVRGQDALGNWGALGSAALYLDKAGPRISGLGLSPNPANGSVDVLLSATADDRATGDSLVNAAEYSLDGGTSWLPMTLGASGTSVKALSATILAADVMALGEGSHPVLVRAQDEWGNWSDPAATVNLVVGLNGPTVSAVALNPATLDFTQPNVPAVVRLTATVDAVSLLVNNAEGFIGTVGAPGTGFDLFPADGFFNETVEDVYYDIPSWTFSGYLSGDYPIYVLGQDEAGNWSATPGSATLTIVNDVADTAGPSVSGLALSPNPTAGAANVSLTGVATDVNLMSNIVAAEYWMGTNPKKAKPVAMTAVDGAFDSPSELIAGIVDIARNMKPGTYVVSVRAMDAAGNWGPVTTIELIVSNG